MAYTFHGLMLPSSNYNLMRSSSPPTHQFTHHFARLIVDVPHLPSILGAEVFEPDVSERLTVGVAMGLGVSATGGADFQKFWDKTTVIYTQKECICLCFIFFVVFRNCLQMPWHQTHMLHVWNIYLQLAWIRGKYSIHGAFGKVTMHLGDQWSRLKHFPLGQLLFVEASRSKGCGKLTVTGQLGEVMLESVRTAMLGDPSIRWAAFCVGKSW